MNKKTVLSFIFGMVFALSAFADSANYNDDSLGNRDLQPEYSGSTGRNANSQVINNGFYMGLQAGYAASGYDASWLIDKTWDIISIDSVTNSGFSGRLLFGYKFTPYFSTEIGVAMLPNIEFNNMLTVYDPVLINESFKQIAVDILLKGTLPLKAGFELYAKGGVGTVYSYDFELSDATGSVPLTNKITRDFTAILGVGVGYHITDHLIADLSYMRYFGNGGLEATNFGAIGLTYQFGVAGDAV